MLSRIFDLFQPAQGQIGVNEMSVTADKTPPLLVSRHSNWSAAKLFDCRVHLICVALQDAGKSIVSFLDLANDDRLKLAPGVLQIEVGLEKLAQLPHVV